MEPYLALILAMHTRMTEKLLGKNPCMSGMNFLKLQFIALSLFFPVKILRESNEDTQNRFFLNRSCNESSAQTLEPNLFSICTAKPTASPFWNSKQHGCLHFRWWRKKASAHLTSFFIPRSVVHSWPSDARSFSPQALSFWVLWFCGTKILCLVNFRMSGQRYQLSLNVT